MFPENNQIIKFHNRRGNIGCFIAKTRPFDSLWFDVICTGCSPAVTHHRNGLSRRPDDNEDYISRSPVAASRSDILSPKLFDSSNLPLILKHILTDFIECTVRGWPSPLCLVVSIAHGPRDWLRLNKLLRYNLLHKLSCRHKIKIQ